MRVPGGVTVASLLAAAIVLIVASPFVGRVEGDPAFAGNSLAQTVQDSTVVCTVRELHGRSGFLLSYSPNFTGPSTIPASLDVYTGNANHGTTLACILSATTRRPEQPKGRLRRQNRCRNTSTFVPLTHVGLPGPPDRLHSSRALRVGNCSSGPAPSGIAAGLPRPSPFARTPLASRSRSASSTAPGSAACTQAAGAFVTPDLISTSS